MIEYHKILLVANTSQIKKATGSYSGLPELELGFVDPSHVIYSYSVKKNLLSRCGECSFLQLRQSGLALLHFRDGDRVLCKSSGNISKSEKYVAL